MSATLPAPYPSSRPRLPLRRSSILVLMVAVAVIALTLGAVRHARQVRLAMLKAQVARAEGRLAWAMRMQKKGYVSAAQVMSDRLALDRARVELETSGSR